MSDEATKPNGKNGAPKLHYGRLREAAHARRELYADIPAGTDIETLMDPGYWVHYSREIVPGTIVEAFCEDGSWEASFRVMFSGPDGVRMSLRWRVVHAVVNVAEEQTDIHAVKWISPPKKYGVVRVSDGTVLKDGFYPKDRAIAYLKALGA